MNTGRGHDGSACWIGAASLPGRAGQGAGAAELAASWMRFLGAETLLSCSARPL